MQILFKKQTKHSSGSKKSMRAFLKRKANPDSFSKIALALN